MSAEFSRKMTDVGDVHVVSLIGELDLDTAEGLADWITDTPNSAVVIDLAGLTFMDSSGISAMVQVKKKLGESVTLTRPKPNVRRLFELTGLGSWISEWSSDWTSTEG